MASFGSDDRSVALGAQGRASRDHELPQAHTVQALLLFEAILARPNPPDHILIETSGLALPKPLVKAFSWPEVKARITVDGVITVVDSKAFSEGRFADDEAAVQAQREADESLDHDNPLEEVFEDQLLCADMVILNKLDLLEDGVADRIQVELAAHMRGVMYYLASTMHVAHAHKMRGSRWADQTSSFEDMSTTPIAHIFPPRAATLTTQS